MAEQALARAKQQMMEEEGKLRELVQLTQEYEQQARDQQARGMQTIGLVRMQQFMSKLQQAISQQHDQVVISQEMLAQATRLWQMAQGRYQAMESLINKHKTVELQEADKQLQRSIDELVQQRRDSGWS